MTDRPALLRRGLFLERPTLGWNLLEGAAAITAALIAGSVVLLGFGADSVVECASSVILLWRLGAERRTLDREAIARIDLRAHKLVALSLFALAAFVAFDAAQSLWRAQHSESSAIGLVVAAAAIPVMWSLSRAKRQVAASLASRALEADSFQTSACMWLAMVTIAGAGANALFGWWWADPVAALGMTVFVVKEGAEAWRGEDCCEPAIAADVDSCCSKKNCHE